MRLGAGKMEQQVEALVEQACQHERNNQNLW